MSLAACEGADGWWEQVPIQEKMVEYKLLSPEEKRWLKEHNARCVEKLTPLLEGDRRAIKWLRRQ